MHHIFISVCCAVVTSQRWSSVQTYRFYTRLIKCFSAVKEPSTAHPLQNQEHNRVVVSWLKVTGSCRPWCRSYGTTMSTDCSLGKTTGSLCRCTTLFMVTSPAWLLQVEAGKSHNYLHRGHLSDSFSAAGQSWRQYGHQRQQWRSRLSFVYVCRWEHFQKGDFFR